MRFSVAHPADGRAPNTGHIGKPAAGLQGRGASKERANCPQRLSLAVLLWLFGERDAPAFRADGSFHDLADAHGLGGFSGNELDAVIDPRELFIFDPSGRLVAAPKSM